MNRVFPLGRQTLAAAFLAVFLVSTGFAQRQNPSPFGLMGFPYSHAAGNPNALNAADDFMDLYLSTGARWDRRDFWWSVVQPDKETWNWEYFDAAMQDFEENRVHVVVILCYGSAWYGDAPATAAERELFGEYVYQMVNRYKDWVKVWEIWNEPNILPFWSPKPNVEAYSDLLKIAYERAKEADPDCIVLGGALAGADTRFLRGMYENGAGDSFDALSFHTYGNNPTESNQRREIEKLVGVMHEYKNRKAIWLTETGIYTGPAGVSEQIQAERIVKSEIRWVAMDVKRIFQLTLRDWTDDPNAQDAMSYRGLTHASGEAKPAFHAHRTMCSVIGPGRYLGRPALHPNLDAYLFRNAGRDVLAVWAEEGETVQASLDFDSAAIVRTGMRGEEELLVSENGTYNLTITQEPVYFEGVGEKVRFAAGFSFVTQLMQDIQDIEAPAGVEATSLGYRIRNHIGHPFSFSIDFEAPEYVRFRHIEETNLDRAVGALHTNVVLTIDRDAPTGTVPISYTIESSEFDPLTLYADLTVRPALGVGFAPIRHLLRPRGALPLRIANLSSEPIDVEFDFEPASYRPRLPERMTIAPQPVSVLAESTVPLEIDTTALESGSEAVFRATVNASGQPFYAETTLRPLISFRMDREVTIDGSLDEWQAFEKNLTSALFNEEDFNPNLSGGEDDISASGWIAWEPGALLLALEVHDDSLTFSDVMSVWDYDSLQIALDGLNDAQRDENFDSNDFEFEIARMRDGSNLIFAGHYPEGRIPEIVERECDLAISIDEEGGTIKYELRIPDSVITPASVEEGRVLGFSLIHNDNDEGRIGAREGWLELTPGIGYGKHPWEYRDLILWP